MFLTGKARENKTIKISDNLSLDLNNLANPFILKPGDLFCFSSVGSIALKPETCVGTVLKTPAERESKYKPNNHNALGRIDAFAEGRWAIIEFIIWQNETELIQYFLWELEHHIKTEKDIIELFSVGYPIIVGIYNLIFV